MSSNCCCHDRENWGKVEEFQCAGVVAADAAQRSRITSIRVDFNSPVEAATLQPAGAITLSRTRALPNDTVGTVVATGAAGANGRILVAPASGLVSHIILTFDIADGTAVSAGIEHGSLAEGYWRLAIPSLGYLSPLNNPNLRCLFGDANNDGTIDGTDLGTFGNAFNSGAVAYDSNGDGTVDGADLIAFGARFGIRF